MTPMFPDGENNRLGAHAARPEPVSESSSRLAVLVRAPEGFALYREPSAGALPVPAHAGRCRTTATIAPAAPVALRALTASIISIGRASAMPDKELTSWERGDRVLQAYEKINADPGMAYVTDKNYNNVTRIIADLLHYCAHQNRRVPDAGRHMDIDAVMAKARAIYSFEHDTGK
jgi:hypothetical protein